MTSSEHTCKNGIGIIRNVYIDVERYKMVTDNSPFLPGGPLYLPRSIYEEVAGKSKYFAPQELQQIWQKELAAGIEVQPAKSR